MSRPETDEQRIAASYAALADTRRLVASVRGRQPSSPSLPAVFPSAVDELERTVRRYTDGMQPAMQAIAAKRLMAIAQELGITTGAR